ncbi:MAG: IS66 family insertion sequence element accessory protein TnpB [Planctomycetota bacterium]
MLSLPPSVRIYLAREPADMRKAIDGLSALTREVLAEDPLSGHLFVFCNRSGNRIKILYWEGSGYWLLHKRLEKGRFPWPSGPGVKVRLDHAELAAILGGIELDKATRKRWYARPAEKVRPRTNTGATSIVKAAAWERRAAPTSRGRSND